MLSRKGRETGMEREQFQKKLEELGRLAKEKENRLRAEEVREFLGEMELTEEQYQLVFAYLASRLVTVEGYIPAAPEKNPNEKPELTEEEKIFLAQYREELSCLEFLDEEALEELCWEVEESADDGVRARLTEQLLPVVLEIAQSFTGRGLPLGDLVQEGNVGLLLALETLGLRDGETTALSLPVVLEIAQSFTGRGLPLGDLVQEGNVGLLLALETLGLRDGETTALSHLRQEIESAVVQALEEQQTEKQAGDLLAGRLNELRDGIKKLTDELERKVSIEELSVFLDMPVEEIEDLLKIAGEGTGEAPSEEQD